MNTLERKFEDEWLYHQHKLRHYFLRRGVIPDDVDDYLQNVARNLWQHCRAQESLPEDFQAYSRVVAKNELHDAWKAAARRPRLEYAPDEYFENVGAPFADLWGREVPSTRWNFAEEVSIAPFGPSEIIAALELLAPEDYRIVHYLNQGASLQEISTLVDVPIVMLRYRLERLRRRLQRKASPTTRRKLRSQLSEASTPPSWPSFPLPLQKPDAASYLRKLPGYVPEWIVWFSRLSAHTNETDEPITFEVIRRLARETGTLNEEQGRRFLLATVSDKGALLSQKFFQLMPHGEPQLLSFSDIYQLLQKQSVSQDGAAVNDEWMDQIATAWEPTSKWAELTSW